MFDLTHLKTRNGHESSRKRVGRGYGSGYGGHTSTRGSKGQKSRSGGKISPYFEGGQLRLVKRLPYMKGFVNRSKKYPFILKTSIVNKLGVERLCPSTLVEKNLVKKIPKEGVKLLFDEDITNSIVVTGIKVSKSARKSIEKAEGKVL